VPIDEIATVAHLGTTIFVIGVVVALMGLRQAAPTVATAKAVGILRAAKIPLRVQAV
jgi:hypothetical protein